jgi:hypothetical protein
MPRTLTFLRAADTVASGQPEDNWPITPAGREACVKRYESLGRPKYDQVVVAPTVAAQQSAIALGNLWSRHTFSEITDLLPQSVMDFHPIVGLRRTHRDEPLSIYLDPLLQNQDLIDLQLKYGQRCWNRFWHQVHGGNNVLFVADGYIIALMGLTACHKIAEQAAALRRTRFLTGEGFILHLNVSTLEPERLELVVGELV